MFLNLNVCGCVPAFDSTILLSISILWDMDEAIL